MKAAAFVFDAGIMQGSFHVTSPQISGLLHLTITDFDETCRVYQAY